MSTTPISKKVLEASSRLKAGVVVGFYLITLLIGGFFLFSGGSVGLVGDLTGAVSYIAVTILFYALVKERKNQL